MDILNKIPKKNEDLAWRVIDDEAVVLNLNNQPEEGEEIKGLNKTATRIWELINGKTTVEDIINKIVDEYDIEFSEGKKQIRDLIKNLSNKKLIIIKKSG